jgi:hypothetical protein
MAKEQEDKIIKQAQEILERRLGVNPELKVKLPECTILWLISFRRTDGGKELIPYIMQNYRGEDKVYIKAELDFITSSKRNMQLWLDGTPMRYRNHKRDKKGKLESVECLFVEYRNIITEVK